MIQDVEVLVGNPELANFFEDVCSELKAQTKTTSAIFKLVANYLLSDLQGLLREQKISSLRGVSFKITPENFAEFIKMIHKNEISSKVAKMVLAEMYNTGVDPSNIVEDNNWGQMKDDGQLEKIITEVISKNPKAVADYTAGNKNSLQFLAGQVMAITRGTANPQQVQEILKKVMK